MKRTSKATRERELRRLRLLRARVERRYRRHDRIKRRVRRRREKVALRANRSPTGRRVVLPEVLSLIRSSEMREKLVDALAKIRRYVVDPQVRTVTLCFDNVESLHPCGTLLFVAEVERLLAVEAGRSKLRCTYPTNHVVEQLFQHIGLLQKLGLQPRIDKIEAENVIVWLYEVGDEDNLDSIVGSLPELLTTSGNKALRVAVTSGMTEAVANSAEHAYIHRRKDGTNISVPHRWWIFARREEDDISVCICDLGIGIPRSLRKTFPEEVASFFYNKPGKKKDDHKMIELALTVGRSRTGKSYRGQGLKDILKVVKEQGVGLLKIYSNKGVYIYDGKAGQLVSRSESSNIMGTLVQWRIPLAAFNS